MVEQLPVKQFVSGSSPDGGARHKSAPGYARYSLVSDYVERIFWKLENIF